MLGANGHLTRDPEDEGDTRVMMTLGAGLNRPKPSETDPVSFLVWTSAPLEEDLEIVGEIELQLDATSTASDTAWIATLRTLGLVTYDMQVSLQPGSRQPAKRRPDPVR